MGIIVKDFQLKQGNFSTKKMKGALLLFGLLVCASMTEASSVRRARNHLKVNQNRHFKQTVDRVAADISVADVCGCGDNCDQEFLHAYYACPQEDYLPDDDAYMACLASNFDDDCHDCLCDFLYTETGVSCP